MADRSIIVRLRAEVSEFVRGMQQAKKATEDVGQAAPKADSSLQKMVQSARDNREAWTTAGTALTAFGTAIVGVGAAALKTGIEYNTLQQTSRAALTTLTGSAEAANAQMDKLDAFARTSPFAKGVFIQAQQQMLGFGIEANKVIPYLDAIQNAVAATGGSNQDIAELTRIFSQVQAAAKITATDLMQFGQRGVDAATLIGTQMDMTGAQVREAITAGTLDAGQALDALAAGMEQRFGGAADNVKNTFAGSMDRVKAAWRDLSSELASGLVDPQGGGGLVDWLNGIADAMRRFQAAPDWVRGGTAALAGLVGVAALLGGGALVLIPRLVSLYDALGQLGPAGERAQAAMGKFGNALPAAGRIASLAGAILSVASATGMLIDQLNAGNAAMGRNALERGIRSIAESGAGLEEVSAQFSNFGKVLGLDVVTSVDDLGSAMDRLLDKKAFWEWGGGTQALERFVGALPGVTSSLEQVEGRFSELDQTLAGMVQAGHADTVRAFLEQLYAEAESRGWTIDQINGLLAQTEDALIGVEDAAAGADGAVRSVGGAFDYTTGKVRDHATALQEMIDKQREAAGVVLDQREAQRRFEEAVAGVSDALSKQVDELARQYEQQGMGADAARRRAEAEVEAANKLDISTEAGRRNQAALDEVAAAGWRLIDSAKANGASQGELQGIMSTTRDRVIAAAESMGMARADAERYADSLGLIPAYVGTKVTVDTLAAHAAIDELRRKASASIQMRVNVNENYVPARSPNQIMRAGGGSVFGPGTETSDSIPALLSHNEHVLSAREVRGMGGHGAVERLRALARKGAVPQYAFAAGGAVVSRPMSAFATGGAVRAPSITVPDTVRLSPESVRQVAEAIVAGAHEVSTGVLAGAARSAAGSSSTRGLTW